MPSITIHKLDLSGAEVTSYRADVVTRTPTSLVAEARWTRDRLDLGYVVFDTGDRFVEHFFTDRWYNVFEIRAGADDRLKGWYCNVTRPTEIDSAHLRWTDLALDVFIFPDGRVLVLDEDEFEALTLTEEERRKGRRAVGEVMEAYGRK